VYLALLVVDVAVKVALTVATFRTAKEVESAGSRVVYAANARGAKVATLVCAVVSVAVIALGARLAF
jgi:hypothetical protein